VVRGQESPYVVTYDHYLEEPGSLEIEYFFHLRDSARWQRLSRLLGGV
jgi:hypothetical protein